MNYDASQVGVPFVRAHFIEISYPDGGLMPTAVIHQSLAVKLADGTSRKLDDLPRMSIAFDFAADGNTPIPLVDPNTAAPLGTNTTIQMTMLSILAVIRHNQILQESTP